MWALSQFGSAGLSLIAEDETLAEGIRIQQPVRGDAIMRMMTRLGGQFLAVEEKNILPAQDQLAKRGFYVEPTSAVVWSGLDQIVETATGPIVIILTGSGLKSECSRDQNHQKRSRRGGINGK
jgi:threonine synthase